MLHISKGNSKLGAHIINVSLPPIITCRKGAPCAKDGACYALKFYKARPTCKKAWDENLELYKSNPFEFWGQVIKAAKEAPYFRWFVAGDIPDAKFYRGMCNCARKCKGTQFLCFTKQYEIVNRETARGEEKPANLHIVFSEWDGLELVNPYRFPVAHVLMPGDKPKKNWKLCGGNCEECICAGIGCWMLRKGQHVAFEKH